MTRKDLIINLHRKFPQFSKADVDLIVKNILKNVEFQLVKGGRIEIRGFGSFKTQLRRARIGRNPKSGISVKLPERCVPRFKPGIELRNILKRLT